MGDTMTIQHLLMKCGQFLLRPVYNLESSEQKKRVTKMFSIVDVPPFLSLNGLGTMIAPCNNPNYHFDWVDDFLRD
jgi:hypothetical protein